jgi:hypothetical protein
MRSGPALVVAMVLAGCWSERAAPTTPAALAAMERPREPWPASAPSRYVPPAQDRCAVVIAHVFDLTKDASGGRFPIAMLDELQQATVESCHETQWSEESLDCYEATVSSSDTTDCYRSMTMEQREDFERRFNDIHQRHRSAMVPQPSSP